VLELLSRLAAGSWSVGQGRIAVGMLAVEACRTAAINRAGAAR
jgi:hypothetical protein